MQLILHISPRIKRAFDKRKPILAMESTVLTHGLPYPKNLDILKTLENLCQELDVEQPATIIILTGKFILKTEVGKSYITAQNEEAGKN